MSYEGSTVKPVAGAAFFPRHGALGAGIVVRKKQKKADSHVQTYESTSSRSYPLCYHLAADLAEPDQGYRLKTHHCAEDVQPLRVFAGLGTRRKKQNGQPLGQPLIHQTPFN